MYRFMGYEHKSGTFEGRAYDNYMVHLVTDEKTSAWVAGDLVQVEKIPAAQFEQVFDRSLKPGMECEVVFNRYGRASSIRAVSNADVMRPSK